VYGSWVLTNYKNKNKNKKESVKKFKLKHKIPESVSTIK
jgi:hypothetical protein